MEKKTRIVKNSFSSGKNILTEEKELKSYCSPHYHDFYEIDIVLDGEGISECNGEEFPIKKGMITFVSPEDLHSYRMEGTMHEINIQFTYDAVDTPLISFLNNVKNNVIYVDDVVLYSIYSLFCLLHTSDDITTSKEYSSRLLECIILSFKDKFKTDTVRESKPSSVLQNAIVYIHSHFKEDPRMRDVAKYLYLNENYFSQMFKENMGVSYKEYVRRLKLEHAKKLLIYTDLPVTKIAYDSGYNSQSHFNRDFKSYYGIPPLEMRR